MYEMGGVNVTKIKVKDNEELDHALRRFKKECQKSGIISEIRRHEYYESPSVRRKKKLLAAQRKQKRRW
jgi:small subunit ribosomal protein S21